MARPNDLFKNTGTGGSSPAPRSALNFSGAPATPTTGQADPDHVTAQKPGKEHAMHKPAKVQGGSGGSGARPKV